MDVQESRNLFIQPPDLSEVFFIIVMCADPEPRYNISLHDADGTIFPFRVPGEMRTVLPFDLTATVFPVLRTLSKIA